MGAISVTLEECMNKTANILTKPRDYMSIVKRLTFNLQNNGELRSQVAHGRMPPAVLVMLNPKELATKDLKQMRQGTVVVYKTKQEQRAETAIAAGVKNAGISMYTCPKCESRNCDSFAMQTRGADEPMTIFVTCVRRPEKTNVCALWVLLVVSKHKCLWFCNEFVLFLIWWVFCDGTNFGIALF